MLYDNNFLLSQTEYWGEMSEKYPEEDLSLVLYTKKENQAYIYKDFKTLLAKIVAIRS